MILYAINRELETALDCVDEETGELLVDGDMLDALLMEREEKIEGIALAIKNMAAEAAAIKAEEDSLSARRLYLERGIKRMKKYLQNSLGGEKFRTARVAISFRNSEAVGIKNDAEFIQWATSHAEKFLRYKDPEINRTEIKSALKAGESIPGAYMEKRTSMIIK